MQCPDLGGSGGGGILVGGGGRGCLQWCTRIGDNGPGTDDKTERVQWMQLKIGLGYVNT